MVLSKRQHTLLMGIRFCKFVITHPQIINPCDLSVTTVFYAESIDPLLNIERPEKLMNFTINYIRIHI